MQVENGKEMCLDCHESAKKFILDNFKPELLDYSLSKFIRYQVYISEAEEKLDDFFKRNKAKK